MSLYQSQRQNVAQNVGVAEKNVQVQVFDNFDELAPMQQGWDDFVESVGGEIFLTYDWCRIWWKYYGKNRELKVFVFRSNGKLVGIIPLFFEKIWLGPVFVKAAKIVGSDFTLTQFSLPLADSYIRPVVKKFYELVSKDNCDIIHIGPIAGLYNHYDDLKNACEELLGNSHLVKSENKGVQTYLQLPDSWQEYLKSLSKNMQRNINRSYRDLSRIDSDKAEPLATKIAESHNCEEIFDAFVRMHQLHWQQLGKLGHFADWPEAAQFHREMATTQLKHKRLRLLQLKLGNHILGYQYGYKFANKYHAFLNARSPLDRILGANPAISLGIIVFSEQLKRALEEKVDYIDLMCGNDEYKLHMGGKVFPIRSLYVIPRKLPTMIRVFIFRLLARVLTIVYHKIWFRRVVPWLKLKPRPLWKIWIRTQFCL